MTNAIRCKKIVFVDYAVRIVAVLVDVRNGAKVDFQIVSVRVELDGRIVNCATGRRAESQLIETKCDGRVAIKLRHKAIDIARARVAQLQTERRVPFFFFSFAVRVRARLTATCHIFLGYKPKQRKFALPANEALRLAVWRLEARRV